VLSPHLSSNVVAHARFEAEAKTISSLSHPNICTLHDVGREEATEYLVMELLEGETLAARIAQSLSPDGSLVLARGAGEKYFLFPIAGGEPRPVPGLAEADLVAHWSVDGRSVLAYRRAEIPFRLERVSLDTGQRRLFKELAPADRAGPLSLRGVFVTDDLRSYAYTTYHQVSSLFVSEGAE
jgi:hypothetical protein